MISHWINGTSYQEKAEMVYPVTNPAKGIRINEVPFAGDATCRHAIDIAQHAYTHWSMSTPAQRARILFEFRHLLFTHEKELVELVTLEQGKTLADAKGSLLRGIELVEWYCGIVSQWQTPLTHQAGTDIDCYTLRQPLGVCLGISPFNFPIMVPMWMMIPAIACGNTFILKPSEQDPSAGVYLASLLKKAGLPDGVVNVVHGDKNTVEKLVSHPQIMAVSAVASTPVAKHIYQKAVSLNKRVQTFGGAKNHAVVMNDADLEQTAKAIVGAAYGSAGQRCMALSVVVTVGEETADKLISYMLPMVKAIRIGPGENPNVDMGPVISQQQKERLLRLVKEGEEAGATLLVNGENFDLPDEGYFLGPYLFDYVLPSMALYREELFGPVLVIVRADSMQGALDIINANPYGNGCAIFTQDGGIARIFAEKVTVGMVGINIPIPVPIVSHAFGGWKDSSFGDIRMHGTDSLNFYTRSKTVTTRWLHKDESVFIMPTNE